MNVLLVETANLYYCVNKRFPNHKLDYGAYLQALEEKYGKFDSRIAFVAKGGSYYTEDEEKLSEQDDPEGFIKYLGCVGFEVRTKPTLRRRVAGRFIWTTDWTVEITIEVARAKVDATIVIGCSHIALLPLLQWAGDIHLEAAGIGNLMREAAATASEISSKVLKDETTEATK